MPNAIHRHKKQKTLVSPLGFNFIHLVGWIRNPCRPMELSALQIAGPKYGTSAQNSTLTLPVSISAL